VNSGSTRLCLQIEKGGARDVKGSGFGILGDIIVGIVGALLGGFLAGLVLSDTIGVIGSFILAFLGAVVLLWLLRLLGGRRARA
jgi:uncharacterized membrane protein YeaQ/YmgE (transglycosylase-associated protein family)